MKILFTNDLHSAPGYLSRAFSIIKKLRNDGETLVFDAGDAGASIAPARTELWFNRVGYAGSVIGNEAGASILQRLLHQHHPEGSVLTNAGSRLCGVNRWQTVRIGDRTVGFFGLVPQYPYQTPEDKSGNQLMTDPIQASRDGVDALRKNSDLVVCISHLGLGRDISLLEQIEGIDVLIGGHTHHRTEQPIIVNGTSLLQAGCNGAYVGVFDLSNNTLKADGGHIVPSWTFEEDAAIEAELYDSAEANGEILWNAPKGIAASPLTELPREIGDPWQENRWANALTDIVRHAAGTEISLLKANSILPLVPGGVFTQWDMAKCFPGLLLDEAFDFGTVFVGSVSGRALLAAAENAVCDLVCDAHPRAPTDNYSTTHNLLHTSGLEICYDLSQPVGHRAIDVSAGGSSIANDQVYAIATDGFLATGKSGFRMLAETTDWTPIGQLRDVIESGLTRLHDLPPIDGRLAFI